MLRRASPKSKRREMSPGKDEKKESSPRRKMDKKD